MLLAAMPVLAKDCNKPCAWLKPGVELTYGLNMGYDFIATVKEMGKDLVFGFAMTNTMKTAGTVTIKEEALKTATAQNNYFSNGELTLADKTTVWVSKKVYDALKKAEAVTIRPSDEDEVLKFVKAEKLTVSKDGKPFEVPTLYGETDKGHKFWILDNAENPLIIKMVINFEINLKEIKSAK